MNKKLMRARAKHNEWLKKNGLLPSQIRARLGKPKPLSTWDASPMPKPGQCMTYTATNKSIWEKIRLGNEKPETVKAIIAKSKRIAPAYSKGAVQYLGDDPDVIRNAGKKNAI
jgi:hypothetical protein